MDVLGAKASYLNLSGTLGGIVEKIRRQHGGVWFWIFDSYSNAHFSTSHRGKTHCLVRRRETHARSRLVCVRGDMKTKCQASCPFQHRLQTVLSQFTNSPFVSCLLIFEQQKKGSNNQRRVSFHCRGRYITNWCVCWGQNGLKWPGKAGYWPAFEDVLRTLNP